MKITVEIDCTPGEARDFFGLPDLTDLHAAVTEELRAKMASSLGALDPETLVKSWFSGDLQGWKQMQNKFWAAAGMKAPDEEPE